MHCVDQAHRADFKQPDVVGNQRRVIEPSPGKPLLVETTSHGLKEKQLVDTRFSYQRVVLRPGLTRPFDREAHYHRSSRASAIRERLGGKSFNTSSLEYNVASPRRSCSTLRMISAIASGSISSAVTGGRGSVRSWILPAVTSALAISLLPVLPPQVYQPRSRPRACYVT